MIECRLNCLPHLAVMVALETLLSFGLSGSPWLDLCLSGFLSAFPSTSLDGTPRGSGLPSPPLPLVHPLFQQTLLREFAHHMPVWGLNSASPVLTAAMNSRPWKVSSAWTAVITHGLPSPENSSTPTASAFYRPRTIHIWISTPGG